MSSYVVVDSSVAVKWLKPDDESGLDEALQILQSHQREEQLIAVPSHLRLEVLNALWSHGLAESRLIAAAAALEDMRLEWFAVDAGLGADAVAIACSYGLTLYDSAFAALTRRLDAELITADAALASSGACRVRLLQG